LGRKQTEPKPVEKSARAHRRSVYIVKNVNEGDFFTSDNVKSVRPANGLHPRELANVLGKRASRDVKKGMPVCWDVIA